MRAIRLSLAIFAAATQAQAGVISGDATCQAAAAFSDARRGAEILVLRDGKPVCEAYSGEGAPDHRMELWSGTKSFSGLMLAAAVQDGLVALDEPVSKTLPEWRDDTRKAKATIRDLLTLSAGLRGPVGRPPTYADAVLLPLESEPGQVFSYGPASYQVWGEVMRRKLAAAGQPADPYLYLKRRILDPIGLTDIVWRRNPAGDPLLPQGAVLTAREWARFGEFVRAGARVGGKPLVDPATFHALFVSSPANPAYGVTWWLPHVASSMDHVGSRSDLGTQAAELPADLVMAAGAGDQRLYVIPSRHLTIVRLATYNLRTMLTREARGEPWSDATFLKLVLADPALR